MMEIESETPEQQSENPHLLSDQLKWMIVHFKGQGWSNKNVAKELGDTYSRPGLSPHTVKSIWEKYKKTKKVDNAWSKEGRPKVLGEEEMEELKEYFQDHPKKSINEAKLDLCLPASRSTLNREVLDLGLKAYRAPKKIFISDNNVALRYEWALRMKQKGLNYWKSMIFSDESNFSLFNPNGRLFLRRTFGGDYEDNIQCKGRTQSLMVWGTISWKGVGPLVRVDQIEEGESTLNGARYLKVLQRYLLQRYPGLKNQTLRFQHDNAPSHNCGIVEDWLAYKNIKLLDWPAQSPDMNIIECVWNDLKHRLRGESFETKDELWKRLVKEWGSITTEWIQDLYESMPRRINALVEAEGRHTKY